MKLKNNIKKAFTLAEILIVLMIVGVLAVLALRNLNNKNMEEKQFQASTYKIVQEFQGALIKMREIEIEKCPASAFTVDIMGEEEYAIYGSTSTLATTDQVFSMFDNYLKFDQKDISFCDNTDAFKDSYCAEAKKANIKGAKVAGDMYIGFEVIANTTTGVLADCPSYYRVNPNEEMPATGKCWGRLYLDVNGKGQPNEYGKDVFVFGLDTQGIVY